MTIKPASLRRQVTIWLVMYAALLSVAVFVHGDIVNNQAEQATWRSLLQSELDHFIQRSDEDPRYRWTDTDNVHLYGDDDASPIPERFRGFGPGIHDGVMDEGRAKVLLVREVRGRQLVLALDITELEKHEQALGLWMLGSNVLSILILGALVAWGLGRVIKPMSDMAQRIRHLQPDRQGQTVESDRRASAEQVVITDALNDYLKRNDAFVEREKDFINSVSHELRTPIAVISGASEIGLSYPGTSAPVSHQLERIKQTAENVGELISILLVLAKDPARLTSTSDFLPLHELVADIIGDHRYLTASKDLEITFEARAEATIFAPMAIVQVVVGNLLRNAIENSGRGKIVVILSEPATLSIEDPGHGMSPEEISALYSRMARGEARQGNGIGLELIARLCGHLGWALNFSGSANGGTCVIVELGQSKLRAPSQH